MKKGWLIGALLLLLALLWGWQQRGLPAEGEQVRIWKGWSGRARHDEFALAKDFLAARGISLTVETAGQLPQAGELLDEVLLLDQYLNGSAADQAQLRAWVEGGGRLIILGNRDWAAYFGQPLEETGRIYPYQFDDKAVLWRQAGSAELSIAPTMLAALADTAHAKKKSSPQHGTLFSDAYPQALFGRQLALGKGEVLVLGHAAALWHNHDHEGRGARLQEEQEYVPLARADHAAYLHALLQGRSRARLMTGQLDAAQDSPLRHLMDARLPDPKWWPALSAALIGIAALLWRGGRRFGPVRQLSADAGRDMQRHLLAAGHFWAQQPELGYAWLAGQMRARLSAQWAAEGQARTEDAAAQAVLYGALPQNEQQFIEFVRKAEALRGILRRQDE